MLVGEVFPAPDKVFVEFVHFVEVVAFDLFGDDEFVGFFVFDDAALLEQIIFIGGDEFEL